MEVFMWHCLTILIGFGSINLVLSRTASKEHEVGKLLFVNVLFRHGDRTPINPYPNDPYKNRSFWPVGFGQLTNTGKQQEFELGQWLQRRYAALLTEEYSPDVVYVQSTNVDRTLMSAASCLAGMFPPDKAQRWNPDLEWQPIPVHTCPEELDKVLAAKSHCPAFDEEYAKLMHSKEIKELDKKYSNVYRILNENTGKNITSLFDILDVFNTLFIENLYNFTLPAWTKDIFPQPLEEAAAYSFALNTWTPKLARLKTGLLVQDMINHLKKKSENKLKPNRNLWIYSAHDTTVGNLLNTLRVFDLQNPPYSATVLMELRVDSGGNHQVLLFYRNSTAHEPYLLTLPGCTAVCPLDQFVSLCSAVIPHDWDRECQASSLFSLASEYSLLTHAALVISALLFLLLVFSTMLYWQKTKRPTHCRGYWRFFIVPGDMLISSKLQAQTVGHNIIK